VQEHQGEIGVTSSAAEGTRFTVTLPRRVRSPPAQAPAGPPRRAAPDDCAKGHRRRVLVVEDDETAREALREMLKHAGYDVTTAANGREALDLLTSAPRPCVVLLDLMMPVMSGWQVLEALEQRGALSDLAVVAVSAATGACSAPIGVRRCLLKPLRAETLLAAVAESCGA
jgi:CheY-like chemotaxis protein